MKGTNSAFGRMFTGLWVTLVVAVGCCAVPALAQASPTFTVSGTVVDSAGNPVSGADVLITSNGPNGTPISGDTGSIPVASITTGSNGQYSAAIPNGYANYAIEVSASGYADDFFNGATGGSPPATFTLASAAFSGSAFSDKGPAGQTVTIDDETASKTGTPVVTDAFGNYAVPESAVTAGDKYELQAPPGAPYESDASGIGSTGSGQPTQLTATSTDQGGLNMTASVSSVISGVVSSGSGAVSGAEVGLVSAADPNAFVSGIPVAYTASDGSYTLDAVIPAGTYLVEVVPPLLSGDASGFYSTTSGVAELPSAAFQLTITGSSGTTSTVDRTGTNILISASGALSGTVLNSEGVQVDSDGCAGTFPAISGSDGSFLTPDLTPGNYTSFIDESGGGSVLLDLPSAGGTTAPTGQAAQLSQTAVTGGQTAQTVPGGLGLGTITGTVTNDPRGNVGSAEVNVLNARGDLIAETLTRSSGAYTLGGLLAGTYYVEFLPPADPNVGDSASAGQFSGGAQTLAAATPVTVITATQTVNGRLGSYNPNGFGASTRDTPAPVILGTPAVGHTLTAATNSWVCQTDLQYQWLANNKPVSGATASTLAVNPALSGKTISVTVSGYMPGYISTSVTSIPTGAVPLLKLRTAVPKIGGTLTVGHTLTATVGNWTAKTKFTYQWYANGKKLGGATKRTFRLGKAEQGKRIALKVTGKLAGHVTATRTSAETRKITR